MSSQTTQCDPQTFQYEPLPTPTSIRLLSWAGTLASQPKISGIPTLEFTLETVDLDTSPDYKALSYTWGNPNGRPADPTLDEYSKDKKLPLVLNGRAYFVTKNLFEALQQFFIGGNDDIHRRFRPHHKTTLIRAAEVGDKDIVLQCLWLGANIDIQDDFGKTALHYAAQNDHKDIVKTLLDYGANHEVRDEGGLTPSRACLQNSYKHKDRAALLYPNLDSIVETLRDARPHDERRKDIPSHKLMQAEIRLYNLWVDAICINQKDIEERTAQVALMSRIYSAARSVVVWLGSEYCFIQDVTGNRYQGGPDGESVIDVKSLSSRTWFRRKWVVQEFCLAKEIEIYCGAFRVDADMTLLGQRARDMRRLRDFFQLDSWWITSNFPSLIARTWHFEATDPRDLIFSLLGLVDEYCDVNNIIADYSKSTEEVFLEAGRLFVEAKGYGKVDWPTSYESRGLEPLEGLSFVQHESVPLGNSPSWVPNFSAGQRTARFWCTDVRASGKELRCKIWLSDPHLLKVDGLFLDCATEVEGNSGKQIAESIPVVYDIASWFRIALGLEMRYQKTYDKSRVDVLWETLIGPNHWAIKYPEELNAQAWKQFVCDQMEKCDEHVHQLLDQLRVGYEKHNSSLPTSEEAKRERPLGEKAIRRGFIWSGLDKVYPCLREFYPHRQLFRTEQRYLGLGPRSMITVDQIWLLAGARVPFVLRPVKDLQGRGDFRLVGECYVPGMMQGEAVNTGAVNFHPIKIA